MSKRRKNPEAAGPFPTAASKAAPHPPPPHPVSWLSRLGLAAALCLVVLLGYYPALHGGFIWDDTVLLTESPLIKASDGLYRFWLTTEAPDYWPLTYTSFWLEWRLWGGNPTGYHVTNLVLHAVEALLLWAVLARLRIGGAFLAALLFAAHPVNVESVAWIAQRKNLVAMLFFLPAILCYLEADEAPPARGPYGRRAARWYWLSLFLFLLALLGKGSAAVLPLVLLLLAWWRRRRLTAWDAYRVVPFMLVAAALVAVNIWFQTHGSGPIRDAGLAERLLGAGAVVWFYLGKALVPLDLAFVYPQWNIRPSEPLWWIPLIATVGVSALLWRYRSTWSRPLLAAWAFFCVALLPVMGLTDVYFMTYSLVADHYQHLALIGAVALVAAGWNEWQRRARGPHRLAAVAAAVGLVGGLTILTARQAATYQTAETIYRATISTYPHVWMAHYNLAVELRAQGRRREALTHFEHTLRVKPDYAQGHNNLAIALSDEGRTREALSHAEQAVRLQPDLPEARVTLGSILNKEGRAADALPHLERALQLRSSSSEVHYNLGMALAAVDRLPEAMGHYHEALRLEPDSAPARNALATGWLTAGRYAEACAELERALALEPDFAEAHGNLALALVRSGRTQEAIVQYQEVVRLRPDDAGAHYNLGVLLAAAGRRPEAVSQLERALRLRPDYAEAHNNLAVALFGEGRIGEALAHLEQAARIKPGFLEAQVNLAETYARSGRFSEAVSRGRIALGIAPPSQRQALEGKIQAWLGRIGRR